MVFLGFRFDLFVQNGPQHIKVYISILIIIWGHLGVYFDVCFFDFSVEVTLPIIRYLVLNLYTISRGTQRCPGVEWFVRRRCLSNLASLFF